MTALTILFGVVMFAIALFLILLVLVQRGRGGGLSGALGGMGGQSAFGTKAGDLFTRITIVVATIWILVCIAAILVLNPQKRATARDGGEGKEYTTIESTDKDKDSKETAADKTASSVKETTGGMSATGDKAEKAPKDEKAATRDKAAASTDAVESKEAGAVKAESPASAGNEKPSDK